MWRFVSVFASSWFVCLSTFGLIAAFDQRKAGQVSGWSHTHTHGGARAHAHTHARTERETERQRDIDIDTETERRKQTVRQRQTNWQRQRETEIEGKKNVVMSCGRVLLKYLCRQQGRFQLFSICQRTRLPYLRPDYSLGAIDSKLDSKVRCLCFQIDGITLHSVWGGVRGIWSTG